MQNGAVVNVTGTGDPNTNNLLYLAVGYSGRVEMSGGLINIGAPDNTGQHSRGDRTQLVNDGVIEGTGTIQTGVFRNRYLGRVIVNAGQSLVVNAASNLSPNPSSTTFDPLLNFGTINVIGTQFSPAMIEFQRSNPDGTTTVNGIRNSFQNMRITPGVGLPIQGGIISAQWAQLRFDSSLDNQGVVAFTAGDNYVTGNVRNEATGSITAIGPSTKVIFQNDLINAGGLIDLVKPGVTPFIIQGFTFINTGVFNVTLDPTTTTPFSIAGNAGIAGSLQVSLTGFTAGSLKVGDSFPIISAQAIGGVNVTDPHNPKVDFSMAPLFSSVGVLPPLTAFGLPASDVLDVVYGAQSISLVVRSIGSASGPDFNGDGVVNGLDLAIWKAHVGITMGATVLDGDANGDGKVDGQDFLLWQLHLGPYPGAGAGSGASLQAVPEPTGLALLLVGALFSAANPQESCFAIALPSRVHIST